MALVAHFNLELHDMDVKTAFLNGDIDETIYMVQQKNCVRRCKANGFQTKEIHLWTQASISSMVLQISPSCQLVRF